MSPWVGFPVTSWSLVSASGDGQPGRWQPALAELLDRYRPALLSHVMRRFSLPLDRSEDLVQSFVASRILEQNLVARADRNRGRFRTFLCTSLDNFVRNTLRDERAAKRSPGTLVPLDEEDSLAGGLAAAPAGDGFDGIWAREVIKRALQAMREECRCDGRSDLWEVFEGRVFRPIMHGEKPMSYECLVSRYGLSSPVQAGNLLITSKRAFARHIRQVLAEYAGDTEGVEEELRSLMEILSGRGARS